MLLGLLVLNKMVELDFCLEIVEPKNIKICIIYSENLTKIATFGWLEKPHSIKMKDFGLF